MNIPPNFSPVSRALLDDASAIALKFGQSQIGSEHLLLATLESGQVASAIFVEAGIEREPLRAALLRRVSGGSGRRRTGDTDRPETPTFRTGAQRAVEVAADLAKSDGSDEVGPAHLVAAIMANTRGVVRSCLDEIGTDDTQLANPPRRENRDSKRASGGSRGETRLPLPRNSRGKVGGEMLPKSAPERAPEGRVQGPRIEVKRTGGRTLIPGGLGWRQILLLAIPITIVLKVTGIGSPIVQFISAAVAVLPLASYMGEATEHLAHRTGATLGGLLNATFGNAAELIIAIVAMRAGLLGLVKASITGSILGNLLLIMGLSLTAGGIRRPILKFNRTAAGMSSAMLVLAVAGLVFPAIFHQLHPREGVHEYFLSEGVAVVLAVTYGASLIFSLKTHKDIFGAVEPADAGSAWSIRRALLVLGIATVGVAFESELLVHATEQVTAVLGLSETFLGLVIIPLIGNAAEHATAVVMARKGKIDL
ncbi:MAG: calcium/proton exchanger, partial [Gemmatimonadota bacterium]